MHWRFIEQETYDASVNMAIDEAICESISSKKQWPTIRFYKWKNNAVSIGSNQNQNEVNLDLCKKNNIDIVRRITGGRAVYHDKADFTYSVIAPINLFHGSINAAYSAICSCLIVALDDLGIKSVLQNRNDIMANGKKISGNAAKLIGNNVYLQHGTIVYDIDLDLMPKILKISEEIARKKIASVSEFNQISQVDVYNALKNSFIKNKDIKIKKISDEELKRSEVLARTKYSSLELPENDLLVNKGACYVESGN